MGPGEKRDTQEWYKLGKESERFEYRGHEIIPKKREGDELIRKAAAQLPPRAGCAQPQWGPRAHIMT